MRAADPLDARAARLPAAGDDADLQRPAAVLRARAATEGSFDLGIQRALERLLVSPQFLFRIEREPANGRRRARAYRVSDLELASRLSFFLWSSIPDDELLDVAVGGTAEGSDGAGAAGAADAGRPALASRWSRTSPRSGCTCATSTPKLPDEILFPDFDETLRAALQRETELFLDSVFRENRSVLDLLTANYTFLNERLARHYGMPNVKGSHFRRVTLPDGQRARRPAGAGQHPDDHVVRDAHLAGAARQVGAREPAVGGAAAAAGRRPVAEDGERRAGQAADAARGDDAAPREPGVRQLPRADGSDRLRDGELRRGGPLARARRRAADRLDRASFRTGRSSTASPG